MAMTMAEEVASHPASKAVPSYVEIWKLISQDGPGETAGAALGLETPERLWNISTAMTMAEEVASLQLNKLSHLLLRCGDWSYRMGPERQQ